MATIAAADINTLVQSAMGTGIRLAVIVAKPDATSDSTAGVYLVKDPDPGTKNTTATQQGTALGGDTDVASPWKSFTHANLKTAYSL